MAPDSPSPDPSGPKLPVGHPQAGYVEPDLSYHEGTGTLPEEEVEFHEARNEAREDEVQRVEENEKRVLTEENEKRLKQEKAAQDERDAEQKKETGTPASSSSTKSS